jgi:uncharacterized protein YvpB
VPVNRQQHNLSCESRSAVDLAAFWGLEIEEDAFLSALPRSDNPYKGFVGNVDAAPGSLPPVGYGVYAEPIAATLRRFGLAAQTRYRLGIEGLRAELAAGRPVLVWATYSLREEPARVWTSADGEVSDIIPWEHTFVAIGYDANGVYLVDPWDQKIQHYTYDAFGASWSRFRQMAVTMQGHLPTCPTCPHRPRRE